MVSPMPSSELYHCSRHRLEFPLTGAIDKTEAKARKELAEKAKGKGPLSTGAQGIKKSGKK